MTDESKLGVCAQERRRVAALSLEEREAEHWRSVANLAVARGDRPPDREAHRASFYERHQP